MWKFLLLILMAALLLPGPVHLEAAPPPQPDSVPTIILFTSDSEGVSMAEAEAESTQTTLLWQVAGFTDAYTIVLEYGQAGNWFLIPRADDVPRQAAGSQQVTIRPTLTFKPPTFRLSVRDAQGEIVNAWQLSIPWITPVENGNVVLPEIVDFVASETPLDVNDLVQGGVQMAVRWQVENRVPASNLIFEQVLPDGGVVNVELPRQSLYIPSSGPGYVRLVYPGAGEPVRLRLRVTDLRSGRDYDEQILEFPVTGTLRPTQTAIPPTRTPAGQTVPQTAPQATVAGTLPAATPFPVTESSFEAVPEEERPQLVNVSVDPVENVQPGDTLTFSWTTVNADSVRLSWGDATGTEQVISDLPANGSHQITIDGPYSAGQVQFFIEARADDYNLSGYEVVNVRTACPTEFFFVEPGREYTYAGGPRNAQPFVICADTAVRTTTAIAQLFSGGMMIYREDTQQTYMFFNGGSYVVGEYPVSGAEISWPDAPPEGQSLPGEAHLFAMWSQVNSNFRQTMGYAIGPVEAYTMRIQSATADADYMVMSMFNGGRFVTFNSDAGRGQRWWAYLNAIN